MQQEINQLSNESVLHKRMEMREELIALEHVAKSGASMTTMQVVDKGQLVHYKCPLPV